METYLQNIPTELFFNCIDCQRSLVTPSQVSFFPFQILFFGQVFDIVEVGKLDEKTVKDGSFVKINLVTCDGTVFNFLDTCKKKYRMAHSR